MTGRDPHAAPQGTHRKSPKAKSQGRAGYLLGEAAEVVARAIHSDYLRRRSNQGAAADHPSLAPWEYLPASLQESNRGQAMDIERKLAQVGCELVSDDPGKSQTFKFTNAEVELLAKLEHERWRTEREVAGWRYGTRKDTERKLSPDLISWELLPEEIREIDRGAVQGLPAALAAAGLAVRRSRR